MRRSWIVVGTICLLAFLVFGTYWRALKDREEDQRLERENQARMQQEEADSLRKEAIIEAAQKQAEERRKAAIAQMQFRDDPRNELPVLSVKELTSRLLDRREPLILSDEQPIRLRVTLKDAEIRQNSLTFDDSPQNFLYMHYEFESFPFVLTTLKAGDEVEFVGEFTNTTDNDVPGHFVSRTYHFYAPSIFTLPK